MNLFPYQQRLIELYNAASDPRPLLVLPPGGGKTFTGLSCVRGEQFIWAAHRRELLDQAEKAAFHLGMPPILTVTVQGLLTMPVKPQGRLVWDECVTGDTIVGGKSARDIEVGDRVEAWSGSAVVKRQVTHVFHNKATTLRTLHVGRAQLTVTDTHPIWIEGKGYVEAVNVSEGDMCRMWKGDQKLWSSSISEDVFEGVLAKEQTSSTDRLCGLRVPFQVDQGNGMGEDVLCCMSKQGIICYDDANEQAPQSSGADSDSTAIPRQSYTFGRMSCEDARNTQAYRTSTEAERRERSRDDGTSREAIEYPWTDVDSGAFCCYGAGISQTRPIYTLQDRSCIGKYIARRRDRRWESSSTRPAGAGCEEGDILAFTRVDRIEVHERGSDGTFGGRCPNGVVYNFEVDGEHNFFANGVLTHNCHHAIADEWSELLKHYPRMLGLSATPENAKGIGLGAIFTSIHVGASFKELIKLGRLVPIEVIAPSKMLKPGQVAQHPVKAYQVHCPGEKAILFAPSVAAAKQYAADFTAAGIAAAHVDGEMPKKERERVIADYCAGRYLVLTNALLLTEGFDDPPTSVVIIARGCSTPGTWIQTTMRCGRALAGKRRGLVLDLRGVSHVHGDPTEDRIYSLEGRGIRRKAELVDARYCGVCGALWTGELCEECGNQVEPLKPPRVVNAKLEKRVYLPKASEEEKVRKLAALMRECQVKKWKPAAAFVRHKVLFGAYPTQVQIAAARRLTLGQKNS